jgi:hypothetical protein
MPPLARRADAERHARVAQGAGERVGRVDDEREVVEPLPIRRGLQRRARRASAESSAAHAGADVR